MCKTGNQRTTGSSRPTINAKLGQVMEHISYDDAVQRMGKLLTLELPLNASNTRGMTKVLVEMLQNISFFVSKQYGYKGRVVSPEEYAPTGEQPWQEFLSSGHNPFPSRISQQTTWQ